MISRRGLLIGGGAGVGLVLAWAAWPRRYAPNLPAIAGEHVFNAWVKIGEDGHVSVAVPQAEGGQGVYTTLPQILADDLGADWRQVAVEPAPLNALYANPLGAEELLGGSLDALPPLLRDAWWRRSGLQLTAGSSSVRAFEDDLRRAGAAARVLLTKAAARRWDADWTSLSVWGGFVRHGDKRLRFGELAAEAARETLPDPLPLRGGEANRLYGRSLPRLDSPSKVDGSASFAGDVRLPEMVFASIRQGPVGDTRLLSANRAAAERIRGVTQVVTTDTFVAAIASTWWAADRALEALSPRFETRGGLVSSDSIAAALGSALNGPGQRMASAGDLSAAFKGARVVTADYAAGLAVHAALETPTATAHWQGDRLEIWLPTQAPGAARRAAAAAIGLSEAAVVLHATQIGGGFGQGLEPGLAAQAAVLAQAARRPVQLVWSRAEDLLHDRYRPPAAARMAARLGTGGQILGWLTKIAAPATGRELAARLLAGDPVTKAAVAVDGRGDPYAIAGAVPPYRLPAVAVDHHPADIGLPTGHWRSGAHSYTCFFTECFLDELAHAAGSEPVSYRIGMLGGDARLARCLSTAAALGGWEGGVAGSGQGIACHSFRGSHVAVLAEAHVDEGQRIRVDRLVAAVDCGRVVNPDIVRQQIEGGLLFGLAAALGGSTGFTENLADMRQLAQLSLPRLADTPDITVELIRSMEEPGGVSELAVPPVAPAIANALQSATGLRLRRLPLSPGNA
ncbi:xanthine dehydrogenase family protein molybdopterin-binding subunit [Sphingomonas aracearum]|uniref:Xanthine dehydrogenase family protein molybdopterin-binding subunit n=1 Tax=Sphingomonas aracearum TaxID=2283317 RepID=A0A369VWM1_9SPHN|nr:molybdopterin cofactor-binding domain-containing protein [Sphingomonas aracearum]RDE06025.1 xanthine dehydrogenase family protein molybdopterin-binding subunit [Sphingomonas aracearum]